MACRFRDVDDHLRTDGRRGVGAAGSSRRSARPPRPAWLPPAAAGSDRARAMGKINRLSARPRQPDRRRRSRRASRLHRQGAGRKRDRRRRPASDHPRRDGRQAAGPRRRRRGRHGPRGCAAGDRAARHQQDPAVRRSRVDCDAGVPRRSAAVDRVGLAFRAADARAKVSRAAPRFASTAARWRRSPRSAPPVGTIVEVNDVFYNLPGTPQVPEVGRRRIRAGVARRDAAGARESRDRLHADEREPHRAAGAAGGVASRSPVSGLRRAQPT